MRFIPELWVATAVAGGLAVLLTGWLVRRGDLGVYALPAMGIAFLALLLLLCVLALRWILSGPVF